MVALAVVRLLAGPATQGQPRRDEISADEAWALLEGM